MYRKRHYSWVFVHKIRFLLHAILLKPLLARYFARYFTRISRKISTYTFLYLKKTIFQIDSTFG